MRGILSRKLSKCAVALTVALAVLSVTLVSAQVVPPVVDEEVQAGDSIMIMKTVTTPSIPQVVDVCLLEDETGSFSDDIANLQGGTTASDIYDTIVAGSPGAQFAVAGFRDYPEYPYGYPGDWVYRRTSGMSPVKADWLAGIAALTAGGGANAPEAQYDAIVAAAGPGVFADPTLGDQPDCGWRDPAITPGVQRVLVVTTDATFHVGPDGTHVNNQATTLAALAAQNIVVVGLAAPGSGGPPGGDLCNLAVATGGSCQELSSDGANIGEAILAGLEAVTTDVWWEVVADPGLTVTLSPAVYMDVPGNTSIVFTETISVDASIPGGTTLNAVVTFIANNYPEEGAPIGTQEITIHVPIMGVGGITDFFATPSSGTGWGAYTWVLGIAGLAGLVGLAMVSRRVRTRLFTRR